ncbi:hypothetical protein [Modestobacter excelsi]|uniref:phage terminase small subunit n=1 Tax=Modestobacter excelsi TaxID=2213161 RepID=UPI00110CD2C7|nr:hypothetical protein [Modestobacter excelsi]
MAGMGPPPKPYGSAARHRWAKPKATAAVLHTPEPGEIREPALPRRAPETAEWHPQTTAWWRDVWGSPMAPEYDNSDRHGLFALAMIVNDFWSTNDARERREAAQEIRLQAQRYGLSPMDRRRLQWDIERADEAQAKSDERRRHRLERAPEPTAVQASPRTDRPVDPRAILRSLPTGDGAS